MATVATALLERDTQLEQLAAWLEEAVEGRGHAVFVSGEAGIGKTALVRALLERAAGRARVAVGHCDALATPRALGPFTDVCDAWGVEPGQGRDALFTRLVAEIRAHAASSGGASIVVVEDVHWADDASIELLAMLARRAAGAPLLLLATYRSDEVEPGGSLQLVLGDLASAAAISWLTPEPLSRAAVAELGGGAQSDEWIDALHQLTGGNPFYVTEALARPGEQVPPTVRLAVLARAARLEAAARSVLDAVSVVPGTAEGWLVDELCPAAADHLGTCVRSGMLVLGRGGVSFRHELARRAIEDELPLERRRALHRRALDALISRGADPARIAHHAVDVGDDAAAARYSATACAVASARSAHREAVRHGERALALAHLLTPDEIAELRTALGASLLSALRIDEALPLLRAAREHWRAAGDGIREAKALVVIASAHIGTGDTPAAVRAAEDAVEALAPYPPGPELATAYVRLTSLHMLARDRDAAVLWGGRAVQLARDLGRFDDLGRALVEMGIADVMDARPSGLDTVREGIEIGVRHGLPALVASGYVQIGSGCGEMRRYDVAVPALEAGIRVADEHGFEYNQRYLVAWLGRCTFDLGRWQEAEAACVDALAGSRANRIACFVALNTLGWLRARRGDGDVWPPLEEALDIARRTRHLQRLWPVAVARAEAGSLEGALTPHVGLLEETMALARACRHTVAVGEIGRWLQRAGRVVEVPPSTHPAFAASIAGDHLRAAAEFQRIGCSYEAALALVDDGATSSLRSALATFRRLGAAPMARRTEEQLRARGVRVTAPSAADDDARPHGLTAREVAVLRCVAAGMSNPQIASSLYVSRKTAEHHVSNILQKLGVASRSEAAAAAVRLGITGD